jgi:prefoldin subunit 5
MKNITAAHKFREAADRVWEMAKEYEEKEWELAKALKDLSSELHNIARNKETTAEKAVKD